MCSMIWPLDPDLQICIFSRIHYARIEALLNRILNPCCNFKPKVNPRAQTNQLFIIPIPGDPFALPSQNSDPIRGPIFVPLNTDCLRYIMFSSFSC